MPYTVEEIGKRAKSRNSNLAKFSDKEVGERIVKRNPKIAAMVAKTPTDSLGITAPQKVVHYSSLPEKPRSTLSFFPRAVADVFTGATQELGGYLGNLMASTKGNVDVHGEAVASPQQVINDAAMREAEANRQLATLMIGKSPEEQARLRSLIGTGSQVQTADRSIPLPSNKQFVGAAIGTGLEALTGSLASAAGAAKAAPTVLRGAVQGGLTGLAYGSVGGASSAMREDKSAGDIAKRAVVGGAVGTVAGAALGGLSAKAGIDASRRVEDQFQKNLAKARGISTKEGLGLKPFSDETARRSGSLGTVLKDKARGIGDSISESPYRFETAAKTARETQEALAKEPEAVRHAIRNGVTLREAKLLKDATPDENKLFSEIADDFGRFAKGETDEPRLKAGEAFRERIAEGEELLRKYGRVLGDAAEALKGTPLRAKHTVLKSLQTTPGLDGVRIDNKGNLDFSHTTLKGPAMESARKSINDWFRTIDGEDAFGLHLMRQSIFEDLGGRKGKVALTATEDRALEAIRKGLADAISEVSPDYKTINKDYARLVEPIKFLRKAYSGLENASDDILDENGAILIRRLTNGGSPKLLSAIEKLDDELEGMSYKSGISLKKVQQFINTISQFHESIKPTSMEGIVATGTKRGFMGTLGKIAGQALDTISVTPEVKLRAFLDLLKR